ncbi:MAG TPA: hypothetical protein VMV92_36240 [Streptosporangiaceae bacterium]|nr:hypothetical protein [Streptosporangiaceae bacterium]
MYSLATDVTRQTQISQLRKSYPVFRIDAARAIRGTETVKLEFHFTCGTEAFTPTVEFTGFRPDETSLCDTPTAQRLIRALAIVEAFSYWKAFCSPVIEVALAPYDEAELAWWQDFWPKAMGEFFYRNKIDFTGQEFLRITAPPAPPTPAATVSLPPVPAHASTTPLVMFSGGKDSLALTFAVREASTSPTDFFLYNPTTRQRLLAESLAEGGRILQVHRTILPELLALNAANHPNGHTPYSAYLALAALLAGYLRGNKMVLAGNSRSDDEPNVESYLGQPINHQWTKSHEFEAALGDYRNRWVPDAPSYSSPLRPLLELQIIQSLSGHIDAYLNTASCNRTKGNGWCRSCAKCAWVFLATSALFGHDLAVQKTGGDMFAVSGLAELYEAMAGLAGAKPFECTGTEEEVRAAIQAVGHKLGTGLPALATRLRAPGVISARPLAVLLSDWGHDDLVPAPLRTRVRQAMHS